MLKAIALMGATGTGKSALAMKIARKFGLSIISCDSMQLYRGLDIGTAKPSNEEQQAVPHFMINCADLSETYSAARWADEAAEVIAAENGAGRTPLIVGGTGMYLRALLEGFADIPAEKPEIREKFVELQKKHGTPYLHALLKKVDQETAERLNEGDSQRIIRALGVYHSSGIALSRWQCQASAEKRKITCPLIVLKIEREALRELLAKRFHRMMDAGWLEEIRWLNDQGVGEMHPAMRAVGYRQLLSHLSGECSLDEAIRDGITATRRYAKRQQTWFVNQTPEATFGDTKVCYDVLSELLGQ
jgi:tRNA dimethylallyltransferase